MNTRLILAVIFLCLSYGMARPLDDGNKWFAKGEYDKALEAYFKARADMPDSRLLNYNIGTALYKLGQYDKAKQELGQAVFATDTILARNAAFNLANVHYREGQKLEKPAERIAAWRESIALLKKAIDLDPKYESAKRNVEIVQRKLKEELDKNKQQQDPNQKNDQDKPPMSEAAKAALAKALQLSSQGYYTEAKAVLDPVIASDDTAEPLKPYLQRIQDVIDIREGREPSRPMDQSNNDQELEVI